MILIIPNSIGFVGYVANPTAKHVDLIPKRRSEMLYELQAFPMIFRGNFVARNNTQ
jgi:hypothetical protein